jgi:hypoxanthine phosphoribosyltransferase
VLLVDDVVTTGATLTTCADLLAAAPSVEGVWALALCDVARRVPPRVVTTSRTTAEAL